MSKVESGEGESREYQEFLDKFRHKKTTDDCYTPPNIYEAVRCWAVQEYGLQGREVVRPFYPGGDYEHYNYPAGCVVIDNPPFSIITKICRFYESRGIDYFLFAPGKTLFSCNWGKSNYIITDSKITYMNGAAVSTGFCTNLGEYKIMVRPDLRSKINDATDKRSGVYHTYEYPEQVISAALVVYQSCLCHCPPV